MFEGIEVIIGRNGKHYIKSILSDFDEKYMMKWFTRGDYSSDMEKVLFLFTNNLAYNLTSWQLFESLALEEHKLNLYGGLEVARQTSALAHQERL